MFYSSIPRKVLETRQWNIAEQTVNMSVFTVPVRGGRERERVSARESTRAREQESKRERTRESERERARERARERESERVRAVVAIRG